LILHMVAQANEWLQMYAVPVASMPLTVRETFATIRMTRL